MNYKLSSYLQLNDLLNRLKNKLKINKIINNFDISFDIEESIFEFTLEYLYIDDYSDKYLQLIYNNKLNEILKELEYNESNNYLVENLLNGSINGNEIGFMKREELNPLIWGNLIDKIKLNEKNSKREAVKTNRKCINCGSDYFYEIRLQLSSGDEGTTTKFECANCGKRGKFR